MKAPSRKSVEKLHAAWLARFRHATDARGSTAELARLMIADPSLRTGSFDSLTVHLSRIRSGISKPSVDLFFWLTAWMDGNGF